MTTRTTIITALLVLLAGACDSEVTGTKETVTGSAWQGWGAIKNPTSGHNMYIRIDNGDTPAMYVRWTSCSNGQKGALRLSNLTPFQGALGTGFVKDTCAQPESRFVSTSSTGKNVAYFETYFDDHYHF